MPDRHQFHHLLVVCSKARLLKNIVFVAQLEEQSRMEEVDGAEQGAAVDRLTIQHEHHEVHEVLEVKQCQTIQSLRFHLSSPSYLLHATAVISDFPLDKISMLCSRCQDCHTLQGILGVEELLPVGGVGVAHEIFNPGSSP